MRCIATATDACRDDSLAIHTGFKLTSILTSVANDCNKVFAKLVQE